MTKVILLAQTMFVFASLAGCMHFGVEGEEALLGSEEMDIAEAVIRYHHPGIEMGSDLVDEAVYLSIYDKDPSKSFLHRFEDSLIPIKVGSLHNLSGGPPWFDIHEIRLEGSERAMVGASDQIHSLFFIRYEFIVEKKNDTWEVTKAKKIE
jgi:hypothetical protein